MKISQMGCALNYSSSASIRYTNGTVFDVAVVHGTEAYVQAMKHSQRLDTVYMFPWLKTSDYILWEYLSEFLG